MKTLTAIILLLLFNSCTKDKELVVEQKKQDVNTNDTTDTISPVILADSIYYLDILDTVLQSVKEYNTIMTCVPIPGDSLSKYNLDVTGDGTYDLTFSCKTTYNLVSASNPCANYDYRINVETTGSDGIIASPFEFIDTLSYNSVIDGNKAYKQGITWLKINSPVGWFCWPINHEYYLGFKVVRNGITMYGWVLISLGNNFNSITIKSFAINRRDGLDITAGQIN